MTGAEFIKAITKQIEDKNLLNTHYFPYDLEQDLRKIEFGRRGLYSAELGSDVQAARDENDKTLNSGAANA